MSHTFQQFDLIPEIKKALEQKGYKNPTPIQEGSIPILIKGSDLIGIAQTGTGKTASFLIPIIQRLVENKKKARPAHMRALILTPTRELATQIEESFQAYSKGLALSSCVIFGGVKANPQIKNMQKGQQLVVATPGRLLDLMNEGHIRYEQLEVFVLDEADRMLDMGFINDIKKVVKKLPVKRQTAMFSATMSKEIEKIAGGLLLSPKKIEVTPQATTVEKIDQSVLFVEKAKKLLLLQEIIKAKKIKSSLIFSRTKHGCDRIVKKLARYHIKASAIHGNKSQNARETALREFKQGEVQALVATDIAARGIDIPEVGHVFNYDIPNDPSSYVHRIGRTARAGKQGSAIAFCDKEEEKLLKAVEKVIKTKVPKNKEFAALVGSLKLPKPVSKSQKKVKAKPRPQRRSSKKA